MRGPQAPDVPKGLGGGGPFCIGIRQFRRDLAVKPQLHLYIYMYLSQRGAREFSRSLERARWARPTLEMAGVTPGVGYA